MQAPLQNFNVIQLFIFSSTKICFFS